MISFIQTLKRIASIALLLGISSQVMAADLVITLTNLDPIEGKLRISLFDKAEGFPGEDEQAFVKKEVAVTGKTMEVTFENIDRSSIAVSVHHDVDNDDEMDTNFIGIPSEPIGSSNNVRPSFGPPEYEDAEIVITEPTTRLAIKVEPIF